MTQVVTHKKRLALACLPELAKLSGPTGCTEAQTRFPIRINLKSKMLKNWMPELVVSNGKEVQVPTSFFEIRGIKNLEILA